MRAINLANAKKRDAEVAFETAPRQQNIRMTLPDGGDYRSVKLLKSTANLDKLTEQYGSMKAVGEAIIESDPEVDLEMVGKILSRTHRLYLTASGELAYRVNLEQVIYNADGSERERRDVSKLPSNIAGEIPIQWSGRKFPKKDAVRRFVFARNYQIRHTSGLTYDFLYEMAKELQEADALMFVGAGKKGNEPILLTAGGDPYRGFLEGRVEGDSYCLILHLTNLELKPLPETADSAT